MTISDRALFTRRDVLRTASLAALAALLPPVLRGGEWSRLISTSKVLILLELEGGNDGLNTIVPFSQAAYATRRANLRLTRAASDTADYTSTYVQLGGSGYTFSGAASGLVGALDQFGIHKALIQLQPAWQAGDLAAVLGVGYDNPNRSHFRGIDIWNNAATDDQAFISSGWLGRMFAGEGLDAASTTNGVLLRRPNNSPLAKAAVRAVSLSTPEDFLDASEDLAELVTTAPTATGNAALDLVLQARWQAVQARSSIADAMAAAGKLADWDAKFPSGKAPVNSVLGPQCEHVARCISGGLDCPFYKISIGGFDNHTDQQVKHADLLGDIGRSLAALRTSLIACGRWDDVLIMTYSEFGRRVEQNGSLGTDHGTVAPHFFMGGKVNGGLHGTQPSLASIDLDSRGDMLQTIDFRRLYATCGSWLGVTPTNIAGALQLDSGLSFAAIPGVVG